ncbi:ABC transporter substrate-binding protein [Nonomuraea soli]|uniref:Putative aliphatic sulfonates-binding protein n=1 Tax=Nonomuraea soli TaxID=1032476 RepID=A0A7W0HQD6_9ACTN|nr:ABC transporter substrate-binding protein [Nonomuraea soli]MBA2891804.1 sulfonate transport system substrate-binding protein [Nonomuraea soli]
MKRIVAIAVLLLATATACSKQEDVTLRIGDQKGTGLQALLQASGQLKDVPYKISWSQFTSGPPIMEAINAGSVDLGAVGNSPPVFAAAAGSKIAIIGVAEKGLTGQAIVVPANSAIQSPADLKGKKIAVAKGSSANFHLLAVLQKAGLSFSDISPQYLQPPDALAALSTGSIDAWAIWDPYTAQAQEQVKARILVDGTGYANGFEFQIAGTAALGEKSEAIGDYIRRIRLAHEWANTHPAEWAAVYAKLTGLPPSVVTVALNRNRFTDINLDSATIARQQLVADAFSGAGLIPHAVKIADIVDGRFNR